MSDPVISKLDIEKYIHNLQWSPDRTDLERTLVAGNLRSLYHVMCSELQTERLSRLDAEREADYYRQKLGVTDDVKAPVPPLIAIGEDPRVIMEDGLYPVLTMGDGSFRFAKVMDPDTMPTWAGIAFWLSATQVPIGTESDEYQFQPLMESKPLLVLRSTNTDSIRNVGRFLVEIADLCDAKREGK